MTNTNLAILAIAVATTTLTVLASVYLTFPGDSFALREIVQLRTPWLEALAMAVSSAGGGGIGWGLPVPWIPLAAVAAALAARRWADAVFLAVSTLAPVVNLADQGTGGEAEA